VQPSANAFDDHDTPEDDDAPERTMATTAAAAPASGEDAGDDQLAMFGVVRPEDPEPVKARRTRKTATREERPKRTRKAPARRRASKS
jgi:hypothetical protein